MQQKISTIVDKKVWDEFKAFSHESHQNISGLMNEAMQEFLNKKKVRPTFLKCTLDSLAENQDLLRRLSK